MKKTQPDTSVAPMKGQEAVQEILPKHKAVCCLLFFLPFSCGGRVCFLVFKYYETGRSVDQTHPIGCGISVFGDILNSTGKVLE